MPSLFKVSDQQFKRWLVDGGRMSQFSRMQLAAAMYQRKEMNVHAFLHAMFWLFGDDDRMEWIDQPQEIQFLVDALIKPRNT